MQQAELNVRAQPVGGEVVPVTLTPAAMNPSGCSSILILIHGYNNSYTDATASYNRFLSILEQTATSALGIPVYKFFWPGDKDLKWYSALSYPTQIKTVQEAAEKFRDFLLPIHGPAGGPIDVHFIAHSLGNRLLLDLLDTLRGAQQIIVRSVTMMAAAVPVGKAQYGGGLYNATRVPLYSQALHSKSDAVLHYAFPLGETACFDGFMPTAVGREGEPIANWNSNQAFDTFAHGDYWLTPGPASLVLPRLNMSTSRVSAGSGIPSRLILDRTIGTRALG